MNTVNFLSAGVERDKELLTLVNQAAAILLAASDEEDVGNYLSEGIGLISRHIDIDRVYIYRNEVVDGGLNFTLTYNWIDNADSPEKNVPDDISFPYKSVPGWEEKFRRGECVNGAIKNLTPAEQNFYKEYYIKSVLVIPVFLQEQFWGIVSYNDYRNERFFADNELEILRSASMMMVNAIYRHDQTTQILKANERARLLLDSTPLCCEIWDQDLNLFDCNEEAVKLFNAKDKQELMEKYFELSPEYQPDGMLSLEKAVMMLQKAIEEGRCVYEWMHQTLNGKPIPCEITLVRVDYEDGYAIAAYNRDLREHKKMMGEIEHRDELLNTVTQTATILLESEISDFNNTVQIALGMLGEAVDVDRVYIWKNYTEDGRLFCTQLYEWSGGAEPQQGTEITLGIPYDENIPTWEEPLSKGDCINSLVRDRPPEEQEQLTPQGILSILIVPIFLKDRFWGFIGFDDCHNETLFSENEVVILKSGSLLIANAMLRNDITQELAVALEEAQAASRAKSEFLSNMSHEIRTPLNAVIGMTSIGISTTELDRKQYCFNKIASASKHLLGVVNDVLDMSKIEAGKFELALTAFNFEKMLQRVVDVSLFRIDEKHQIFKLQLDKNIPNCLIGDDQCLAQIITNLLGNAVKFTPENGEIRLAVNLLELNKETCQIQVDVIDTGIGISKEQQARLFQSFEQAESGTSRKFGGTGLGLAISKRIVEIMGGKLWVESEPGEGSAFSFTVELGIAEDDKCDISYMYKDRIKKLRVLAVDDEQDELDLFSDVSRQANIECETARTCGDALNLIEQGNNYDIYFVDQAIQDMDGIEISRLIREKDAGNPFIILTSSFGETLADIRAVEAGIDKIISKPIFPSALIDIFNECAGADIYNITKDKSDEKEDDFAGFRILIVDDVDINREIAIALLEPTMLQADSAVNGIEAVKMFSEAPEKYDLILMDIQMPEMDGYEATRRIRSLGIKKAKDIPIIAMTANVFREDIEKCKEAGMNEHVGKPLDTDILLRVLRNYLNKNNL